MKRDERVVRSASLPLPFRKHMQNAYGLTSAQVHRTRPVQIPKRSDFTILAVLGRSGVGKTATLRNIQPDTSKWINNIRWKMQLPVITQVHSNPEEAGKLLNAVGLRSMPVWLLAYKDLSTGQQARAHMTRALTNSNVSVIDEFGSTIDPLTRQCMAYTFQKAVRARDRSVVVAVNDERILPFLKPDRVFDANSGDWIPGMVHSKVPICMTLKLLDTPTATSLWKRFKYEHYLSNVMQLACAAYGVYLKSPMLPDVTEAVGLVVLNCLPGWNDPKQSQENTRIMHRLVIDPSVQGIGLGARSADLVGGMCKKAGLDMLLHTSHKSMQSHLSRSPLWDTKGTHKATVWKAAVPDRSLERYVYVGPSARAAPKKCELGCRGMPRSEKFSLSFNFSI